MKVMSKKDVLRAIPSTNELLDNPLLQKRISQLGRDAVLQEIRSTLELVRFQLSSDEGEEGIEILKSLQSPADIEVHILKGLQARFDELDQKGLKRVINGTGIILHTNLGRAPLPREAAAAMAYLSGGYCNLEYDLKTGARGSRHDHLEETLCCLTGAEGAMIVNNNAAAVFLCLNTFANQQEVLVSRGEQVEIGGSFRIPDIITRSGCIMVEVGTTNKTHREDYAQAISPGTALLLKVHTSNYKISGFTREVSLQELVQLGREQGVPTMVDLGSGCLISLSFLGIPGEPTVSDCVSAGADLITFSGDKLLGGPQAGIILGKREALDRLKKNPLSRMVRCDKSTIIALKETLELYRSPEEAFSSIPVLSMLSHSQDQLKNKAIALLTLLEDALGSLARLQIEEVEEEVGGGSLPGILLKGAALTLTTEVLQINELQRRLREAPVPLVCRVFQDRLYIHLRTIEEDDFPLIAKALKKLLEGSR
jgi:L-seryl-tRNA(Ser) seleniumtransferase